MNYAASRVPRAELQGVTGSLDCPISTCEWVTEQQQQARTLGFGTWSNTHVAYSLLLLSYVVLVGVVGTALKAERTDSSRKQGYSFRERSGAGIALVPAERGLYRASRRMPRLALL